MWLGYLGAMLLAASLLVAGAWRLIETQRKAPAISVPDRVLLAHQTSKFEHPTAATLFLGDSSLGNAISAARWQELAGHSAANLALTGVYGYAGSYNFLRRALQRGRPDNVVIMHTADMPTRAVWDRAYELTKPEPNALERLSNYWQDTMNFQQLVTAVRALYAPSAPEQPRKRRKKKPLLLADDYIVQRSPLPVSRQRTRIDARQLAPRNLEYLRQIAALCQAENLNCLYLWGPLAQLTCESSEAYLGAASQLVSSSGIHLVADRPLCLEAEAVGDEVDHVRPTHKRRVTEYYYEVLRPFLK